MPEIEHLRNYLESLRRDRLQIDGKILEVEKLLERHSGNGTSPARSTPAHASPPVAPPVAERAPYSASYPGVTLRGLIAEELAAGPLDRQQLQERVAAREYSFVSKSFDVVLRRLEERGVVRKLPKPAHEQRGKFKNLWALTDQRRGER